MTITPIISIHLFAAGAAFLIGPFVLWARLGKVIRPWLHRALGYAWTTLMIVAAVSAIFIRSYDLPNIWGYSPLHLFVVLTAISLFRAFRALYQKNIQVHRRVMQRLYFGACLLAGLFTLIPGRYLGNLLWHTVLGVI